MSLSIGERLKSAREAKGINLEEAARFTKVQRWILESIEGNRIDEVLDPAYRKIFLKKYAAYLGLDGTALVREYLSLFGPVEEPAVVLNKRLPKEEPPPVLRVILPALVGLMSVVGVAFIGYLALDLYGNLKKNGKTVRPAASVSASSRQTIPALSAATSKWIVPLSKPLKLTIRTRADVWIQIKSDGVVIFQNVLNEGASESWTAKKDLELWTGNAGAMELVLNGKPLENPARGVKKGIKVTHAGLMVPG